MSRITSYTPCSEQAHWDELRARYEDAAGQPANDEAAADLVTAVGQVLNHRDGLHARPVTPGSMDDLAYCVSQEHRLISRLEELGRRPSQEARQQEQAVREALEIYRARIAELAVGAVEVV